MSKTIIARVLLGAIFITTGLNGFFHFLPMVPLPSRAGAFMEALGATGYFFPFLKTLETICGVLLLTGTLVPLTLVVLAPIVSNILMFHFFLAPSGLPLPLMIAVLLAYLSFFADPYAPIVKMLFRLHLSEPISIKKMKSIHVS